MNAVILNISPTYIIPERIPASKPLDFYDIGSKISKLLASKRSGNILRQLNDFYTSERTFRGISTGLFAIHLHLRLADLGLADAHLTRAEHNFIGIGDYRCSLVLSNLQWKSEFSVFLAQYSFVGPRKVID